MTGLQRRLREYVLLTRLDRPIGILLLLWPVLWALWLASNGLPEPKLLVIFVLGTVLTRSAGCIVMDDSTDMVYQVMRLASFYAHESCGKRTPCREGGTWLMRMLERVIAGYGTDADLDQMREVGQTICPGDMPHASSKRLGLEAVPFPYKMTTICFVGPSAWAPLHSALTLFPEEFEAIVTKVPKRVSIPVTALSGADA